jgi:hypothetical protein
VAEGARRRLREQWWHFFREFHLVLCPSTSLDGHKLSVANVS